MRAEAGRQQFRALCEVSREVLWCVWCVGGGGHTATRQDLGKEGSALFFTFGRKLAMCGRLGKTGCLDAWGTSSSVGSGRLRRKGETRKGTMARLPALRVERLDCKPAIWKDGP